MRESYRETIQSIKIEKDTLNVSLDSVAVIIKDSSQVAIKHNENLDKTIGGLPMEIASPMIALVAVIVAQIIQIFITKRVLKSQSQNIARQIDSQNQITRHQIAADFISKNELEWVEKLRTHLSEFLTLLFVLGKDHVSILPFDELSNSVQKMILSETQISLLLDRKKKSHIELENKVHEATLKCYNKNSDEFDNKLIFEIVTVARTIFDETNDKIQKLNEEMKASKGN